MTTQDRGTATGGTVERHASRVHDEIMDLGELGYHGAMRETYRAWVAECSCGWVFGHGIGVTAWRNRESARLKWREHAKSASAASVSSATQMGRADG
jgi:hypothetical protein